MSAAVVGNDVAGDHKALVMITGAPLQSGELDEELRRMTSSIDRIAPNSIVLLNESFASTNEREGSEIARRIVRALLESGVKVFYVTHMFDLAQGFYLSKMKGALFLRAERLSDGRRTFRLTEGEPLPTSYGEDLYGRIFGRTPGMAEGNYLNRWPGAVGRKRIMTSIRRGANLMCLPLT